jgi:hypothetical protein
VLLAATIKCDPATTTPNAVRRGAHARQRSQVFHYCLQIGTVQTLPSVADPARSEPAYNDLRAANLHSKLVQILRASLGSCYRCVARTGAG